MRNSSGRLARKLASTSALVALIAGSVAFTGPPTGAAPGPKWTVVKSPSPAGPAQGELSSVSCGSPTSCFAVGYGSSGMIIERWNGSGWSFVKTPKPTGVLDAELNAVSCSSATNCLAVGDTLERKGNAIVAGGIAERWNGRTWSLVPVPVPAQAGDLSLNAVSCASAKSCFAVGDVSIGPIPSPDDFFAELTYKTIIERWNGKTWSVVSSPNPPGAEVSLLAGVSCVTAKNCWAVGDFFGRRSGGSLIEHWNGNRWSIVASPNPGGASIPQLKRRIKPGIVVSFEVSGGLNGVSCSTANSCFAVGGGIEGNALIERWNGSKWSVVPSPAPPGAHGSELAAVSCATPTDCSAVGESFTGSFNDEGPIFIDDFTDALSEHWDGTAWSIVAQPPGAQFSYLSGISCPKTNNCSAVGDSAFVERWNGTTWKLAPFTSKTSQSTLIAVSCPTTGGCVAVGRYTETSATKTLAEHHVGSHWRIMPSPNPAGAISSQFSGVSCVTASDCTAVGSALTIPAGPEPFPTSQALIEHWNGSTWSIVPNPATSATNSQLTSVSCPSASNCTTVGITSTTQGGVLPLVERWNGSTWSIVPSPAPAFGFLTFLSSVSCPSASNCTAVGYYEAGTGDRRLVARTLVEHWNGASWSIVPSPNLKALDFNALFSVSCPTASNCSAVGLSEESSGAGERMLAEHWNGKSWVIVPTPNPPRTISSTLGSISCRGTSSCYAAGYSSTVRTEQTLIEHWNGTSWKVLPSPNPGTDGAGFNGISCASRYTCTAVGGYGANSGFFTLIERGP